MSYCECEIKKLKIRAAQVRTDIVEMIPPGKAGHLGGSSSIADITAALYFSHMKVFDDPKDPRRDRLIFSKGHATLAQYSCLQQLGYFDRKELKLVKTLGGVLQGHPDMDKTPGIEAVTGSLGQGLSEALGMALGLKLDGSESRVYCVMGDGELEEGQIWEAAMAAAAYKADNLCGIVDLNLVQATDTVENVLPNSDVAGKFKAFGWNVIELDGHNFEEILSGLDAAKAHKGQPTMIVAHTIKGKGFPFAEGKAAFHNAAMTQEQYDEALEIVRKMREEAEK